MPLPKKDFTIKMGAHSVAVIFSEDVAEEGGSFGSVHHRHQRIFLDPQSPPSKQEETLLHEVTHIIHQQTGLARLLQKVGEGGLELEEMVVQAQTAPLYQFLVDNPGLFTGGE